MSRSSSCSHPLVALISCCLPASAQPDWTPVRSPGPPAVDAAAYDVARGRLVVLSTQRLGSREPATWEWDGTAWLEFRPASSPPARSGHALAYDAARQRVVLFGGVDVSTSLADTWEWDGAIWQQRQPSNVPSARFWHAMSYDLGRQRVVMFGGLGNRIQDDTWEWDGNDWTRRQPATVPAGRFNHRQAFDVARRRTVMCGGDGAGPSAHTWEWDGNDWTAPTAASPGALVDTGMAYDVSRQRIVLCGRLGPLQTWEWDGRTWLQHQPATVPPVAGSIILASDVRAQGIVLLGGSEGGLAGWHWDGRDWTARHLAARPSPRNGAAIACDLARGRVVLFGGARNDNSGCLDDTWEWDGAGWHQLRPLVRPTARRGHALAYDFARGRTVLFGGSTTPQTVMTVDDTWEWDGANWTRIQPASSPPARVGHGMAHDLHRGRTVLFGGGNAAGGFADTWEWDGSSWRQLVTPLAPPAGNRPLAYDAANRQVLLVASGSAQHTWLWDGLTWSPRHPQNLPPPVSLPVLACDLPRQRVVLTGLAIASDLTWEWDGADWRPLPTATKPSLQTAGWTAAYDAARQSVLLQLAAGETWLLGVPGPARTVTFGNGCAGTNGVPLLVATEPHLGNEACALDLLRARTGAPCVFGIASATQTLAVGGGCTLHLAPPAVAHAVLTDASGFVSVRWRVPLDPTLRGAVLYAQAAVADPLGAAGGLAFTAGRRLVLGD